MKKIKKIALVTDFSKASQIATELAKELNKKLDIDLIVIHVFDILLLEPVLYSDFRPTKWEEKIIARYKTKAERTLRELAQQLGSCQQHLLEGIPKNEIVKFVEQNKIDLLIIGTHGYRGVKKFLLGSVAEHTLQHAKCPVLIAKKKDSCEFIL